MQVTHSDMRVAAGAADDGVAVAIAAAGLDVRFLIRV